MVAMSRFSSSCSSSNGPVVHLVPAAEATARALRFCDRLRYPDFSALAADGWAADPEGR